jgi:hypothetical protein
MLLTSNGKLLNNASSAFSDSIVPLYTINSNKKMSIIGSGVYIRFPKDVLV